MYLPDLADFRDHNTGQTFKEAKAVGWLAQGIGFSTGDVNFKHLEKLKHLLLSKAHLIIERGLYPCYFCTPLNEIPITTLGEQKIYMGYGDLWLPTADNRILVAPDMIFHYMEAHSYQPPQEFLSAVAQFEPESDWDSELVYIAIALKYVPEPDHFLRAWIWSILRRDHNLSLGIFSDTLLSHPISKNIQAKIAAYTQQFLETK